MNPMPCPCCGSWPRIRRIPDLDIDEMSSVPGVVIECASVTCGVKTPAVIDRLDEGLKRIIEIWNRRTS